MIRPAPSTNGTAVASSPGERAELVNLYLNAIVGLLRDLKDVEELEAIFQMLIDNLEAATK